MKNQEQQPIDDLKRARRHSYLLRLWRSEGPGCIDWRASLENPETGERIGFARMEELFAYLMDLIDGKSKEFGKE